MCGMGAAGLRRRRRCCCCCCCFANNDDDDAPPAIHLPSPLRFHLHQNDQTEFPFPHAATKRKKRIPNRHKGSPYWHCWPIIPMGPWA